MIVRLTHIDGKLPNLALMKLGAWHRARGDDVRFSRKVYRDMLEPEYDIVYGSAIFSVSGQLVERFRQQFPGAVIGGTGTDDLRTVEQEVGVVGELADYDYSLYPDFQASIGFTQRGCRLKCGFCVVPKKEGKPRTVASVHDIWRGDPYPRHLHLLDNDFFGQQDWHDHIAMIRDGDFKVCFNQGINVRLVTDEVATALATVRYYDDGFTTRRLYTAWDNLKDEGVFFRGVDLLERAGVPPHHLLAYMLIGWDKNETWERILYRFDRMVAKGIRPYPMVYGDRNRTIPVGSAPARLEHRQLREFQRWAIRKAYTFIPFEHYNVNAKGRTETRQLGLPI